MTGDGELRVDGRVEAPQRERDYTLLGAGETLMLGVSEGRDLPAGAAIVLAGDLSRVAFPEIVSLVAHGRRSGVLRVFGRAGMRSVVFTAGEVCSAASERVDERLGDVAVRLGLLKREELETLARDAGDARRAGHLAVERGLLAERDLRNVMQEHATNVFQAILLESRASFVLSEERVDEAFGVPGLSAEGLLMEAVRRLDELSVRRSGDGELERVIADFNEAFRDIFATAEACGAGDALRAAGEAVFENDETHEVFRELAFSAAGELPAGRVMTLLAAKLPGIDAGPLLSAALSRATVFLLFTAGVHLESSVHRQLQARVQEQVSRD